MANVITETTYLIINGVPLATPGFRISDLSPLLDSANLRGTDRLVPGAAGVIAYPRRRTVTVLTFPIDIYGDRTRENVVISDPKMGMVTNLEYLEANLGIASTVGDGTVLAEWERRDTSNKSAYVHVLGFKGGATVGEFTFRTTLDISIPAGRFDISGS